MSLSEEEQLDKLTRLEKLEEDYRHLKLKQDSTESDKSVLQKDLKKAKEKLDEKVA